MKQDEIPFDQLCHLFGTLLAEFERRSNVAAEIFLRQTADNIEHARLQSVVQSRTLQ